MLALYTETVEYLDFKVFEVGHNISFLYLITNKYLVKIFVIEDPRNLSFWFSHMNWFRYIPTYPVPEQKEKTHNDMGYSHAYNCKYFGL